MGKLQELQIKMGWNEEAFLLNDIPTDIFHYTSTGGFESILFNNPEYIELWASRYDCLNDTSEGTVAMEKYQLVCDKMLEEGELQAEIYDILKNIKLPHTTLMWHCKDEKDILTRPEYVRYICSFSKNSDSLAMWNYYSKGNKYEGFNLGFFANQLLESVDLQLREYESKVGLYSVVYHPEEQERLIYEFLCSIIEHYEKVDEMALRYMASNQLLKWSLIFKNECFKHEEEIRLIVDVGVKKYKSQEGIPQIKKYYRIVNGYTVPYIKLKFDKDCLTFATIGPLTCDNHSKKLQEQVLEERLSEAGYTGTIQYSNIPVRY